MTERLRRRIQRGSAAGACLLALLLGPCALAQTAGDERRAAIEQKLKLMEMILASPRVKQAEAGGDPEAHNRIETSRQQLSAARAALKENKLDEAVEALDEALREASTATARLGGANVTLSAERSRNAELVEQVKSYRASLVDARSDAKAGAAASTAIQNIDRLSAQADQLTAAGKWADANRLLAEAYMGAITALSEISAGQTVVLSLKFDTPADEYAYELKRNHSHEILVDMMIQEGRAEGDKRKLVDRYLEEGRRLHQQAEREAKGGDHPVAVKTMERATVQLVRVLQLLGVPVF